MAVSGSGRSFHTLFNVKMLYLDISEILASVVACSAMPELRTRYGPPRDSVPWT